MKPTEILRDITGNHTGYQLAQIAISSLRQDHIDEMKMRRLRSIPGKITAFLHRDKIEKAYKSNCFEDPADEYYIVVATDRTMFHLTY